MAPKLLFLQDDFMLVIARDFDILDDDDDDDDLDYDVTDDIRRSHRRNTKDSSDTIKLLFHAGKPQVFDKKYIWENSYMMSQKCDPKAGRNTQQYTGLF